MYQDLDRRYAEAQGEIRGLQSAMREIEDSRLLSEGV
eukprot:Gb_31501 [translate_table: standard]